MKTILEQIDYYNDEEFSKVFLPVSLGYLSVFEENNSTNSLKRIKFSKLKKVAEDLDSFCPGKEIRKVKKLFIKYLKTILSRPIAALSLKDLADYQAQLLPLF